MEDSKSAADSDSKPGKKVDRLVNRKQQEEDNLMLKLIVLDKMEKIAGELDGDTSGWGQIDRDFEDLTGQWRKIGRVPRPKSDEVWERFKAARDTYYDRKYEFDTRHRQQVDTFRRKKEKVIAETEALLEEEDLASAARKINKLHRRWKKIGNLPQRDEDLLWDRFKAATDAFNERKAKNIDTLREQEEEHYNEKLKLIEEAETLKDTDDWEGGHKGMQKLMDRWKRVGPVSRKASNRLWKQFKGAMDVFYDRRRNHFKEMKEQRKENLAEKKEILQQLDELSRHEDPIGAVEQAKPLQDRFKEAGYVPLRKKDKVWKEYKKICDVIYDRFRAAKSGNAFDQELARADIDRQTRSQIKDLRRDHSRLKKEVRDLEEEIVKYEESKTYFKPTKKGNVLLDEIQEKIDRAETKLEEKKGRLDDLIREMDELTDEEE